MERINGQKPGFRQLAEKVLSWITCAKRPLTTLELQHALAIEVGDYELDEENVPRIDRMVSVSAGLVTVDEESSIIRLVHYTTQEYFERTQHKWFPNAETQIAISCVTYLSFSVFETGPSQTDEELEEKLQSNPLYSYAARNWGHHAHEAAELIPEVICFLRREPQARASSQALIAVRRWADDLDYSQRFPKQIVGLHLAAYFGIETAIRLLLDDNHPELKDSYGRTSLSYAAGNGHEAIVRLLIEKGAEIDSKGTEEGRTPLSWASWSGYEAIVQLLLKNGADIDLKDTEFGRTPLSWAAGSGHEAVVQLLLEKSAEIDSTDSYGRTPLTWAAGSGYEAVVQLLLEKGAEIDSKDTKYGRTPLSRAVLNGHKAVVQLLLDNGAEVDSKEPRYGRTPLTWAAESGHEDAVQILLKKGAEIDSKGTEGRTPLSWAAGSGYEAVVQLLLENGAEIDSKGTEGRTPLSWAAGSGYEAVVQLLLENGAEIDSTDRYGQTPLSRAARTGHEAVVRLLLENGAEIDSTDYCGRTPLSHTARSGNEATFKLLLEVGVNPDAKDHYDSTPLSMSARHNRADMVKLLLATRCVDLNAQDRFGRSALWWAKRRENAAVARLLVNNAEKLPCQDDVPVEVRLLNYQTFRWCDVCTFGIQADSIYFHCGVCFGGDFDVCLECHNIGALCLDEDHNLTKGRT
jgi:ankyrin repeat protein